MEYVHWNSDTKWMHGRNESTILYSGLGHNIWKVIHYLCTSLVYGLLLFLRNLHTVPIVKWLSKCRTYIVGDECKQAMQSTFAWLAAGRLTVRALALLPRPHDLASFLISCCMQVTNMQGLGTRLHMARVLTLQRLLNSELLVLTSAVCERNLVHHSYHSLSYTNWRSKSYRRTLHTKYSFI